MIDQNDRQEKKIDMSGRSNMRIIRADQYEAEQNQKSFDELNNVIDSKIQEYNEKLNRYIEVSLKKTELKHEQPAKATDYWDKSYECQYIIACNSYHKKNHNIIFVPLAFSLFGLFLIFCIKNIQSSVFTPIVAPEPEDIVELPY